MAAADAELGVGVSEVVLHRLGAQVQLGGRLPVGQPGCDQACYPEFLRGQAGQVRVAALPGPDAERVELRFGRAREGPCPQSTERLFGSPHRLDGLTAPLKQGKASPVLQIKYSTVEGQRHAASGEAA